MEPNTSAMGMLTVLAAKKTALAVGAAAMQAAILVGMIGVDSAPLMFGETVRLKVVPVDPRDLFRGDYVVLGYEFSRLPAAMQRSSHSGNWYDSDADREVYVSLRHAADGTYYESAGAGLSRPSSGPYLQGRLTNWGQAQFGIEAWYVQEREGRALEQAIRSGKKVYADVAVWHGTARLKKVVVE